jgi:hypothetical protein
VPVGRSGSPEDASRKRVVQDPSAPPMWARFYEIGTNRPIFCDRDGVAKRELKDIGYERRNGYSSLSYGPQKLLEVDYPAWKRKWASNAITNSLGMKLVLIPAGEFMMGSSQEEIKSWNDWSKQQDLNSINIDDEGPQHRVRITRSFYLAASRREAERLREALRLNEPLAIAYHLKDELSEIWEQDDQETAEALLLDWIVYAESTGIRMLQQFAKTLRFHGFGILAWYDYPISTGPLEGTNNKIKTMKRQAYGFRDPEFLRLKILAIHRTTYALVG